MPFYDHYWTEHGKFVPCSLFFLDFYSHHFFCILLWLFFKFHDYIYQLIPTYCWFYRPERRVTWNRWHCSRSWPRLAPTSRQSTPRSASSSRFSPASDPAMISSRMRPLSWSKLVDLFSMITMPAIKQRLIKQTKINQSTDQWANQSINQSINKWANQSINDPINQSVTQWINQSINRSRNGVYMIYGTLEYFDMRSSLFISSVFWHKFLLKSTSNSSRCAICNTSAPMPIKTLWSWLTNWVEVRELFSSQRAVYSFFLLIFFLLLLFLLLLLQSTTKTWHFLKNTNRGLCFQELARKKALESVGLSAKSSSWPRWLFYHVFLCVFYWIVKLILSMSGGDHVFRDAFRGNLRLATSVSGNQ